MLRLDLREKIEKLPRINIDAKIELGKKLGEFLDFKEKSENFLHFGEKSGYFLDFGEKSGNFLDFGG